MSSSYRKVIKGSDNEAYEEFSHNRITIHAGGAGVLAVSFLIAVLGAMIVWLVVNYGSWLALTLLVLWCGVVLGAVWLGTVYVYSKTGILLSERRRARNHERLVQAGDVSFYLQELNPAYAIYASSAEHNRALIAPGETVKVREIPDNTDTVLELFESGATLRTIAESTGMTFYQVQKLTAEYAKKKQAKKSD